jgi:hypothetical protein
MPSKRLSTVVVKTRDGWTRIGFIYLRTEKILVLLNHITEGADLGPLRAVRKKHIEPEAYIMIFPIAEVESIEEMPFP